MVLALGKVSRRGFGGLSSTVRVKGRVLTEYPAILTFTASDGQEYILTFNDTNNVENIAVGLIR